MSTGTDAESASGADTPSGPRGLPRRNRAAPTPARPREETPEAPRTGDDSAEDTLRPEALARAMTAIHLGSTRARLTAPPETGERSPAARDARQPTAAGGADDERPETSRGSDDSTAATPRGVGGRPTPVRGQGRG